MSDYAALVRVLRKDASEADRVFGASSDKETLQAAADAIETLAGEADQHAAEAFRLARDLREARNEIARLTGQTFEIVDKAAIWDEGYEACDRDEMSGSLASNQRGNPYRIRKEPE